MKRQSIIYSLLLSAMAAVGQDSGHNYIVRRVMLDAEQPRVAETVTYYDGLGRKEEVVQRAVTPDGRDLVSYITRDNAGREHHVYLPSVSTGAGKYVPRDEVAQLAVDTYNDQAPYTTTDYEQSPLGRPLREYGAGQEWRTAARGVTTKYLTNRDGVDSLECRLYRVSDTRSQDDPLVEITLKGSYATGTLHAVWRADEDGNATITFTDLQDREVLVRTISHSGGTATYFDTYKVYDDYGMLTAVLPPKASATMKSDNTTWSSSVSSNNDNDVHRLCYLYAYDRRGRIKAKKLPGCSWQTYTLDQGGRVIYTQDGNLRNDGKRLVTLNDIFGRPVLTGLVKEADVEPVEAVSNRQITAQYDINSATMGLSSSLDLTKIEILSVNYYDSYDFITTLSTSVGSALSYRAMSGYDSKYEADEPELSARGMLTGTATRVLGDTTMLVCSMYYDHNGKVIQSHETNALGGFEHTYSLLSFTGKPLQVMHVHTTADTTMTDIYGYSYDNMERLLSATVCHDGGNAVTLCQNTYNKLGQLASQSLGSSDQGLMEYTYNIRGWTQGISSQQFTQTLYYEQPESGSTPCYNGNISAMKWSALDAMSAEYPTENLYKFGYDGLNRLMAAHYGSSSTQSPNGKLRFESAHDYSTTYEYDLNGNITSLTRKGVNSCITEGDMAMWDFGYIDKLSLTYDGNQLKKVDDECGKLTYAGAMDFKDGANKQVEYSWDANGNMTRDDNKKISKITYNVLNLPERIQFSDGHIVRYTYDARGNKLQVKYLLNNMAVVKDKDLVVFDHNDLVVNDHEHWSGAGITRSQGSTINASRPTGLTGLTGLTEQTGLSGKTNFIVPGILPGLKPFGEKTLLTMDYCGNKVYRNGKLDRINNDYGYQAASTFYYYIKDYQSNVRAVIDQDGNLKEINNYYPYGGLMGAASAGVQPYKYGAKELDRQNGLDWYDFAARYQDPMLPRFTAVDPKAEKYYNISPYAYCAGNPVKYVDPTGKEFLDHSDAGMQLAKVHAFKYFEEYDPNYIYIVGHGGDDGKYFEAYIGTSHMKITADNIDKYLEYHSSVWKEKQKNNEPITIVFISCNTGKADGIAQQVSAKYKNVTTIAPSDILSVGADHRNKDTHSNVQNNGKWIHYRNGKKIGTKPHNAHLGKRKRIQTTNFAGKGKGRYSPTVYHQRWGG